MSIDKIPKWFTGAKLNYAENLLENGADNAIAVYYKGKDGALEATGRQDVLFRWLSNSFTIYVIFSRAIMMQSKMSSTVKNSLISHLFLIAFQFLIPLPLLYVVGEGHPELEKLTFAQLKAKVSAWAAALRSLGVQKNDVVAGILPNGIEVKIGL